MKKISAEIDNIINNAIKNYDNSYHLNNPFEKLISWGELIDRLSIINFKLFTLKNKVLDKSNETEFKAWAATEDIKLVEERARLKKCLDEKLIAIIYKIYTGDPTGGYFPEVKKYG